MAESRRTYIRNRRFMRRAYRYLKAGYWLLFGIILAGPIAALLGFGKIVLDLYPVALPLAAFWLGYAMARVTTDVKATLEGRGR